MTKIKKPCDFIVYAAQTHFTGKVMNTDLVEQVRHSDKQYPFDTISKGNLEVRELDSNAWP